MTKNMKTLIAIAAFVIFMIAAGIIYNSFSERYQAKSPLPAPTAEASQTPDSDDMDNSSPEPGEEKRLEAPDFSAVDGDGNEVRLQDFREPRGAQFLGQLVQPMPEGAARFG